MSNFLTENARIRCKFSARSTCNAPEFRPASLRKHFDVAEFLRRVCDGCNAKNTRIQRSNMRKILQKFASLTHEFAAIFSRFRRAAHQILRLLCEDSDLKVARRRRSFSASQCRVACRKNRAFGDCAFCFPPENSRIHCEFSARSTRIASKFRPTSLRKHVDVQELLN